MDPQTERLQTDCNVFIDRAIEMLKSEYKSNQFTAGYNGVLSLLQYAKESHLQTLEEFKKRSGTLEQVMSEIRNNLKDLA